MRPFRRSKSRDINQLATTSTKARASNSIIREIIFIPNRWKTGFQRSGEPGAGGRKTYYLLIRRAAPTGQDAIAGGAIAEVLGSSVRALS